MLFRSLEVWGSKKTLLARRIFTASEGVKPIIVISSSTGEEVLALDSDDQFLNAMEHFYDNINDEDKKNLEYEHMLKQMEIMNVIIEESN